MPNKAVKPAHPRDVKTHVSSGKSAQASSADVLADSRRVEEQLAEKQALLDAAIGGLSGPFFTVDRKYCYTSFNQQHAGVMKALYGAEIELGHNLLEYHTSPEDRRAAKANLDRALAGEQVVIETFAGDRSKASQYFEIEHRPICAPSGAVTGVAVNARDITSRRQAENDLAHANELLEAVTAGTDVIIATINKNYRYSYFNTAYRDEIERLTGRELKVGMYMTDIFRDMPEQLVSAMAEWGQALEGENTNKTIQFGDPGRRQRWYNILHTPLLDLDGNVIGAGEVAFDVTRQVQAEESLRLSEARYRSLIELSPDPIFVNQEDRIRLVNPAAVDLFGAAGADQVLGKTVFDLFHPDYHDLIRGRIKAALDGQAAPVVEEKIIRLDGGQRDVEVTSARIEDENGPAIQVVLHDITQRKHQEQELHKLNRTMRALSNINQAMLRAADEADFMNAVCRIIVADCGHAMAWIGFAEQDEAGSVRPVANAGFEDGYLETLKLTWADAERGRGPTGTAIRTGQVSMCRNMLTDPQFKPWREQALKRGYASSIALPLKQAEAAFGALTIYAREPDPFSEDEVKLLTELADDLAYGIFTLRVRSRQTKVEQDQRESEERFSKAFHASPVGINLFRLADGRSVDVNEAFLNLVGYSRDEFIGKTAGELNLLVNPELRSGWIQALREGNSVRDLEIHIRQKSGQLVNALFSIVRVDVNGEQMGLIMAIDITVQKRVEGELRKARLQAEQHATELDATFHSITDAVIVYGADGRAQRANQAAVELLGYDPTSEAMDEIARTISSRSLDGEPLQPGQAPSARALHGETVIGETYILKNPRGQDITIQISSTPLWVGNQIAGAVAVFHDVTGQRAAEEKLAWLASFPEVNPNPVVEVEADGSVHYLNPAARKLFPDLESLGRQHPWLAGLDDLLETIRTSDRQLMTRDLRVGGSVYQQTITFASPTGRFRIYCTDITDRKQAEDDLRRVLDELESRVQGRTAELTAANERLNTETGERKRAMESLALAQAYDRSLLESSLDPWVTITLAGKISDVNTATEKVTGRSRQDLIGTDFHAYFSDPEKASLGYQQVFETGSVHDFELELRHKDGHITPVLFNASLFRDENGQVRGVFAMARDITEHRQNEAELEKYRQHLEELVQQRTGQLEATNVRLEAEIGERQRTESALLTERSNLQLIFNVVNVGMLQLDVDSSVKRANQVVTRWTGKSIENITGLQPGNALGCIHASESNAVCGTTPFCSLCRLRSTFEAAQETGQPVHAVEVEMDLAQGDTHKRQWLEVSADPLLVDGVRNVILAINDITPRKEADEELRKARDELELRVRKRTRELNRTNEQLHLEIEERQRMADSLHDAVNQSMFSAGLIAEVLPRLWERDQAEARQSLKDLRRLTRSAQGEMRGILAELRPSVLTDNGLDYLLEQLSNAFSGRTNLPVEITTNGEAVLPASAQVVFYRVCQEALNNIAKHAKATRVEIDFQNVDGRAVLRVCDDGRGFDTRDLKGHHYGLTMMRDRARTIGAELSIDSQPEHGTRLDLKLAKEAKVEATPLCKKHPNRSG